MVMRSRRSCFRSSRALPTPVSTVVPGRDCTEKIGIAATIHSYDGRIAFPFVCGKLMNKVNLPYFAKDYTLKKKRNVINWMHV